MQIPCRGVIVISPPQGLKKPSPAVAGIQRLHRKVRGITAMNLPKGLAAGAETPILESAIFRRGVLCPLASSRVYSPEPSLWITAFAPLRGGGPAETNDVSRTRRSPPRHISEGPTVRTALTVAATTVDRLTDRSACGKLSAAG